MDELFLARMELARLETKVENLHREFLDAKQAVALQRSRIDELVRKRPTPIDRPPDELLSCIFSLAIPSRNGGYLDNFRARMGLAMVSRRWRDIVLNTPKFWTTIDVDPTLPSPVTHLERSRDAPLDVIIRWSRPNHGDHIELFLQNLSCLIPSVHRWRSLVMTGEVRFLPTPNPIRNEFKHLTFPSLKSVVLFPCMSQEPQGKWPLTYPNFLTPQHTPALEHMELNNYAPIADFRTIDTLKSLKVKLCAVSIRGSTFLRQIPTKSLTALSLTGNINHLALTPNDIQFPFLRTLFLQITGGNQFLEAIDAPNLTRLVYVRQPSEGHPAPVVSDLGSKFNGVHWLSFSWARSRVDPWRDPHINYDDAVALLRAFPCVYHAEIDLRALFPLFDNHPDSWKCLQSLTFDTLHSEDWSEDRGLDRLVSWLKERQELGLPLLRLKFTTVQKAAHSRRNDGYLFGMVYKNLQKYCILELEDFLLTSDMTLSMEGNSPLQVVSAMSSMKWNSI